MVPRGGQAAELRAVFNDVHVEVSVRAAHPHALQRALLRVQRVRAHFRARQLPHTVRAAYIHIYDIIEIKLPGLFKWLRLNVLNH